MKYLIDTDRLIDYLNGYRAGVELLDALRRDGLGISMMTVGEIYEGIYFSEEPDPATLEAVFLGMLRWIDVLPLDIAVMRRFARLRGLLRDEGNLIPDPDLLIAATALHHDLTLITRNLRHFERVPDLKLYGPS